uniref:Uncharacterized protein n=1 Tax=Amphimedon queenslandica TaxID=400682 RepID=A0A1X7SQF2_AMPQE
MRTQGRRFITLIDTLYDHKVKLVCTAQGSPSKLFSNKIMTSDSDHTRQLMDDLQINQEDAVSYSIFTGEEELFAYDRTISRLYEMQSNEYIMNNNNNNN